MDKGRQYILPRDEGAVLNDSYKMGVGTYEIRENARKAFTRYLDLPESEFVSALAMHVASHGIDEGHVLTNDEDTYYALCLQGFIDGWQAAKEQSASDHHRIAFNALLGDIEIDL